MYMLDTNIVSDALRNPSGPVAKRISHIPDDEIAVSFVVASELRFGALKRSSRALTALVEGFFAEDGGFAAG